MNFNKIDLREQVEGLKGEWYFEDYKSRTRINKHSVVFDKDFKFELEFSPEDIQQETEDVVLTDDVYIDGFKEASKGDVLHFEKGEVLCEAFVVLSLNGESLGYYSDDNYSNSVNSILKDIMLYIANRI